MMKSILKLAVITSFLFIVFGCTRAQAALPTSQSDSSTITTSGTDAARLKPVVQTFGTGWTGNVSSIGFYAKHDYSTLSSVTLNAVVSVDYGLGSQHDYYAYTDGTCSTLYSQVVTDTKTYVYIPFTYYKLDGAGSCFNSTVNPITITSGVTLNIYIGRTAGTGFQVYGSSASTVSTGQCLRDSLACPSVADIYFDINGVPENAPYSSIVSVTPPDSRVATTSPTYISVSYVAGQDLASSTPYLLITFLNQDTAEYREISTAIDLTAGTHVYSTTTTFSNGLYTMSTMFENSPYAYIGTSTKFIVNSTQFPENALNSYFYGQTASSSSVASSTNFLSFLNVPQLLRTKPPFAYIFQVASILSTAVSSSTLVSTLPSSQFSVSIPTSVSASTTINVDLFSTSTITHFLPAGTIAPLRSFMVVVTYFSLGLTLFYRAKSREII